MNKDNLEIERKYLLKRVPTLGHREHDNFLIHQIYIDLEDQVVRFRMHEKFSKKGSSPIVDRSYVKCIKKPISTGVFEEMEERISQDDFRKMLQKPHTEILKTRHVYRSGGFNWEIDDYHDIKLVVMEVEFDNEEDFKSFNIKQIPEVIRDQIIVEVTGQEEFSNYKLSLNDKV